MDAPSRDCCPFVDVGDARCGDRFRLDSLSDALEMCFSEAHRECPAHAVLARRFGAAGPSAVPVVITVSSHGNNQQLRPTGS
ncbi:MAG: hypothetical protein MK100_06130 [Phycisphaerales bacterium]|nr:hypothetical protein [Phycisphaerales bacterium]